MDVGTEISVLAVVVHFIIMMRCGLFAFSDVCRESVGNLYMQLNLRTGTDRMEITGFYDVQ